MYFDFSAFLLFATVASGVITLCDQIFWRPKRLAQFTEKDVSLKEAKELDKDNQPLIIEYGRSFFPVLLAVFILRSFVVEPYRIPSGSMKPTLLVGDFIAVNKYAYGIKFPVFNKMLYKVGKPQRGDVFVFKYPVNPKENFIKRVVGIPGDVIEYRDKQLYVNGKPQTKTFEKTETFIDDSGQPVTAKRWLEDINGAQHTIYEMPVPGREIYKITVPEGKYFAMGDNRDDSGDSRIWGFVPEENIVGKAFAVWMSWDSSHYRVRTDTIPRKII